MKRMLIVVALAVTASMANAAAFKWAAANIYGSDGTTKWSGEVVLHCVEVTSFSSTQTAAMVLSKLPIQSSLIHSSW